MPSDSTFWSRMRDEKSRERIGAPCAGARVDRGGASERRTLAAIGIGTSALSYCLRDDNNFELRWRQGALAPWRTAVAVMALG